MTGIKRTFNGHDFTFVTCVCGLTKDEYDDCGQPPCTGLPEPVPEMHATNEEHARQAVGEHSASYCGAIRSGSGGCSMTQTPSFIQYRPAIVYG
jgi:hypothetical protein